ncbi:MAG TPA: KTSC domain-containing protein [Pedobacter sp.]|nr:KTSC domain-containing protein [Pedobacter sp.]
MPSTVVEKFEYDPEHKILTIVFKSGRVYQYKDVPYDAYISLRAARSKGRYLNKNIKGVYEYESSDLI